jgi:hypothetical protein
MPAYDLNDPRNWKIVSAALAALYPPFNPAQPPRPHGPQCPCDECIRLRLTYKEGPKP